MHNLIITIRGCDHKINCAVAGFGVWHWECVVECADRVMHFIMTKVDLTLLNYFRLNFMTIELLVHTYSNKNYEGMSNFFNIAIRHKLQFNTQ
jgi:hypothetical protein